MRSCVAGRETPVGPESAASELREQVSAGLIRAQPRVPRMPARVDERRLPLRALEQHSVAVSNVEGRNAPAVWWSASDGCSDQPYGDQSHASESTPTPPKQPDRAQAQRETHPSRNGDPLSRTGELSPDLKAVEEKTERSIEDRRREQTQGRPDA